MSSFRCFLKKHPSLLPWLQLPFLVITLSILLSISFLCNGSIWLRTCILGLVLLFASIFTFLSQQKPVGPQLDNRSINEDVDLSNELENHSDVAENGSRENIESARMGNEDVGDISYSESESNDISFSFQDYSSSPDFSDEESLIELEIPSGIYVASPTQTQKGKQEESKEFISKFIRFHQFDEPMFDFFGSETKEMFKQQSILDLLTEINEMKIEEENLIEIDIAMGSIKCPRFEIEA